mmetsp:Transcript_15794/g.66567  ORF Transcript_15794/g.66567 Transcript_15794/m.66567 type:complete len:250 (+) Transcript_15794:578-1327(+)
MEKKPDVSESFPARGEVRRARRRHEPAAGRSRRRRALLVLRETFSRRRFPAPRAHGRAHLRARGPVPERPRRQSRGDARGRRADARVRLAVRRGAQSRHAHRRGDESRSRGRARRARGGGGPGNRRVPLGVPGPARRFPDRVPRCPEAPGRREVRAVALGPQARRRDRAARRQRGAGAFGGARRGDWKKKQAPRRRGKTRRRRDLDRLGFLDAVRPGAVGVRHGVGGIARVRGREPARGSARTFGGGGR